MSRYTKDVRQVFQTMEPPYKGFIVDIAEYPNTLTLRVYSHNVQEFNQGQKVALAEYLYKLRDTIRGMGVPCEIEGVEGAPPNAKR
jgi:hypothetical protein